MKRERTIIQAISLVLEDSDECLTCKEIYAKIIERGLYVFGAKAPENIVNVELRRHCEGLEFPTASAVKYFVLGEKKDRQCTYGLLKEEQNTEKQNLYDVKENESDERLPEEQMRLAYNLHLSEMKKQLLEKIAVSEPAFFEKLVLDLLLKMGYGYDENAGICVGGPHDGGIDGIIYEDKLGLDKIYIQAKRYAPENSVGRKDVQAFVGAMVDVQKGVFITT